MSPFRPLCISETAKLQAAPRTKWLQHYQFLNGFDFMTPYNVTKSILKNGYVT